MNELYPYLLSLEEMHVLAQEKKFKERKSDLNIFIIASSEINYFFKLLFQNLNNAPNRFQLAIRAGSHWFGVDCKIENHKLALFILDAGDQPNHSVSWFSTKDIKANINSSNTTIFTYKGVPIQFDRENCSFFTLDHLFRLSSKNEHWKDLKDLAVEPDQADIIYFNEKNCPKSLAFIFKNIQSQTNFNALPKILKESPINKKGQTLEEYVSKNTVYDKDLLTDKNQGIKLKREKYMKRYDFFKLNQYENSVTTRQGFEIIGGQLGSMLSEVIRFPEDKSYLESLVLKNKILITSNARLILDIIFNCSLNNLFFILFEKNNINIEFNLNDLYLLFSKNNFALFCPIFDKLKNSPDLDFRKLDRRINAFSGREEFKTYISPSCEKPNFGNG